MLTISRRCSLWQQLLLVGSITVVARGVSCNVNVFLDEFQTRTLVGYSGELYYVRNGVVNENAIKYRLPIPSSVDEIVMKWQNLYPPFHITKLQPVPGDPLPIFMLYTMQMSSGDTSSLLAPVSNVTATGIVPQTETGFSISAKCLTAEHADVPLFLSINITVFDPSIGQNESMKLNFQFTKLCRPEPVSETPTPTPNREPITPVLSSHNTNGFYIAIGVACSVFLVLATSVAALHVHSMPKSNDNKDALSHCDSLSQVGSTLPRSMVSQPGVISAQDKFRRDVRLRLRDVAVSRNLVSLGNIVQEGAFGRVFVGSLTSRENGEEQRVFIKTVTEQASPEQVSIFLVESSLMKRMGDHNVLPIMHVCLEEGLPPLVVLPYMNRGSLKNYLRLSRTSEPMSKTLTTRDIVYMAIQIARGLQYLGKRKVVHRDVAARNCVIDDEFHVKVSDNALARDFFPGDYHCLGDNENRPIRWMAVEALEFKRFTFTGDVWAYGVLLWELTTLAQTPYSNVDPFDMLRYLKSGLRLPQPSNCPDDLFTVMACCWALSAEERPQFSQIVVCLEGFYDTLNAFI